MGMQKEQGFALPSIAFLLTQGPCHQIFLQSGLEAHNWSWEVQPLAALSYHCAQIGMYSGGGPALSLQPSFHYPQN